MNYIQKFKKHYNIGEQDIVRCKVCGQIAADIHHIVYRSQGGTDDIENLIELCRKCHDLAHAKKLTEEQLCYYQKMTNKNY